MTNRYVRIKKTINLIIRRNLKSQGIPEARNITPENPKSNAKDLETIPISNKRSLQILYYSKHPAFHQF